MAKMDKSKIIKLCEGINKKEGDGSVFTLGSKGANLKIPRWSTGIDELDHILGGGMPEGRIIEIFGPEASGKTSLGYHLASLHPLALNIPIEGTFDAERASLFGNKPKQMIVYRAKHGEQAMFKMINFAEAGIPIMILDSIPACKPKEDIEKLKKAARSGNDDASNDRIGGVARLMSQNLPVLEEICEFTGTTIILINQVRDKMDAMMFGEKTDTPGGRAIKFYSSVRIQVARKGWIEIPNKDPHNSAKTEKVGMIMKVKIVKSKVCNPMMEAEIPLFFDRGFVGFDQLATIRKELMKARGSRVTDDDDDDYDSEE
jgi:recombination protein RecA